MNNIIFKTLLLKGEAGQSIESIAKTSTSGLVDTYTITLTDGSTTTFEVTNGSGIDNIAKTSTSGLVDTYTITYTNGTTSTFEVNNGNGIANIAKTSTSGAVDTYTITYTNGTTSTFTVTNSWIDNSEATTTTGQLETVTGGKLSSCIVELTPVQSGSGDPSPTNIRPITGHTEAKVTRTGKNVSPITVNGIKALNTSGTWNGNTYSANGLTLAIETNINNEVTGIKVNGTVTATLAFNLANPIFVAQKAYILSGISGGANDTYKLDIITTQGGGMTRATATTQEVQFTAPNDGYINSNRLVFYAGTSFNDKMFYPMIRIAEDTSASYEPYNGQEVTVDLDGTRYGGTLDVISGVLTVKRAFVEYDGSSDEAWEYGAGAGLNQFYIQNIGIKLSTIDIICNRLKTIALQDRAGNYNTVYAGTNIDTINVNMESITSISDWKNWLSTNNLQIAYALATPITVQLTPEEITTLVGVNNLLAPLDGQEITEAKYRPVYTYEELTDDLVEKTGVWSNSVTGAIDAISVTITNSNILTSSIIEVYSSNASGTPIGLNKVEVTAGQAVVKFDALTEATSFKLRILNL